MRHLLPMMSLLLAGCDTSTVLQQPKDLLLRFPPLERLTFSLAGKIGPAGSGSEVLHGEVAAAQQSLGALSLLGEFLTKGGDYDRDRSITLALEGPPRVADQVLRYTRDRSRLDVERIGDHAFFYLQYDNGQGFDPQNAIGESRMVIEGSTVLPPGEGQRAAISNAVGLADAEEGYLRFHFNHRPEDVDPTHSAGQLDYRLKISKQTLHLTYFVPSSTTGGDATLGCFLLRQDSNTFFYVSQQKEAGSAYKLLAQQQEDGSHAVWDGEGTLLGCYDGAGAELGNEENPAACSAFSAAFPPPPSAPKIWPGLPAGVPK